MKNRIKIATLNFLVIIFCNQMFAQATTTKEILWTTDWSPNGKYIAIGGNIDTLKIYDSSSLKLFKSLPVKNTITRVKWHPTKNMIAVATQMSGDKSSIIDLDTNKKIELNGISPDGARGIDWNYTGEYLAVTDNDGKIFIFNSKGDLIRQINNENTKTLTAVDWHPKKDIFITVSDKIRLFYI